MRNLIAAFIFTSSAMACELGVPLSYVPTFLSPPVSGHYMKCSERPEEQCVCTDGVDPYVSVLIDEMDDLGIFTGKKILVEDAAKKAAHLAAQAAAAQALAQAAADKIAACEALQGLSTAINNVESQIPSSASTVAQLRAEMNAKNALLGNILRKAQGCLK